MLHNNFTSDHKSYNFRKFVERSKQQVRSEEGSKYVVRNGPPYCPIYYWVAPFLPPTGPNDVSIR